MIVPNVLGVAKAPQGLPALPPMVESGVEFPYVTIRDQVSASKVMADQLGIEKFAAVIGGSMGGMHALEWGLMFPGSAERLALIATSAITSADQLGGNSLQREAIIVDPFSKAAITTTTTRAPTEA